MMTPYYNIKASAFVYIKSHLQCDVNMLNMLKKKKKSTFNFVIAILNQKKFLENMCCFKLTVFVNILLDV